MTFVRFPTFQHNTMVTIGDCRIKPEEIKILDDYIVKNNISTMDLATFKNVVCNTFPMWRGEQLCGMEDIVVDNYKKYITYNYE